MINWLNLCILKSTRAARVETVTAMVYLVNGFSLNVALVYNEIVFFSVWRLAQILPNALKRSNFLLHVCEPLSEKPCNRRNVLNECRVYTFKILRSSRGRGWKWEKGKRRKSHKNVVNCQIPKNRIFLGYTPLNISVHLSHLYTRGWKIVKTFEMIKIHNILYVQEVVTHFM